MFTIMNSNGEYFHKEGKIILFESQEEVNGFINYFIRYSVQRLHNEGRVTEAMSAPMVILQRSKIHPVDFDVNAVECGVVFCRDLCKK